MSISKLFYSVMIAGISCLCLIYLTCIFQNFQNYSLGNPKNTNNSDHLAESPTLYSFHYVIPGADICDESYSIHPFLVIIVCSAVKNEERRQAIRETWGSTASKSGNTGSARVAFLLGTSVDGNETRLVREEATIHGDIIQMDFLDNYSNLTYKSIALLQWATEKCSGVSFILKSDDDMYVNIPKLVLEASQMEMKENVMFGVLYRNATPIRNKTHKWYVPMSLYSGKMFPHYLSGSAYAMSGDSAPKLFAASQTLPLFYLEDIFVTGMCASKAGVKRISSKQFSAKTLPATGCAFQSCVTGTNVRIPDMQKIWKELQNVTIKCEQPIKCTPD